MTNPKILERIKALYDAGTIDAEKVNDYVRKEIITQEEADEIIGGGAV